MAVERLNYQKKNLFLSKNELHTAICNYVY